LQTENNKPSTQNCQDFAQGEEISKKKANGIRKDTGFTHGITNVGTSINMWARDLWKDKTLKLFKGAGLRA